MPNRHDITDNLKNAKDLISQAESALGDVRSSLTAGDRDYDIPLTYCEECRNTTFDMSSMSSEWGKSGDDIEAAAAMSARCVFCMLFQYGAIAFEARNALISGNLQEAMALMSVPAELYTGSPYVESDLRTLGTRLGEQWMVEDTLRDNKDRHNKAFAEFVVKAKKLWKRMEEKYDVD